MKNFNINLVNLKITSFEQSPLNGNYNCEDFAIRAYFDDVEIGYLLCYHESGRLYAFEVNVLEEFRQKKVATKMYNYAEEISGKTIYPHHENPWNSNPDDVSDLALLFWKGRRSR